MSSSISVTAVTSTSSSPPCWSSTKIAMAKSPSAPCRQIPISEYGRSIVYFTWAGFYEMDEVNGTGSAELPEDGTARYRACNLGDEAVLDAELAPFFNNIGRASWRGRGCKYG